MGERAKSAEFFLWENGQVGRGLAWRDLQERSQEICQSWGPHPTCSGDGVITAVVQDLQTPSLPVL
jgi:hypothetical protein